MITPGTHGSTYGGNPLACAVATEAIKVTIKVDASIIIQYVQSTTYVKKISGPVSLLNNYDTQKIFSKDVPTVVNFTRFAANRQIHTLTLFSIV